MSISTVLFVLMILFTLGYSDNNVALNNVGDLDNNVGDLDNNVRDLDNNVCDLDNNVANLSYGLSFDQIYLEPYEMIFNFYRDLNKITLLVQGVNETSVYLMPGLLKHYDAELSLIHCNKAFVCIIDELIVEKGDYTLFIVNEGTRQFIDVNIKTTIASGDMWGLLILGFIGLCICCFGLCAAKRRMDISPSPQRDEGMSYVDFMATCPEDVKYPLSDSITNSGYVFEYNPSYKV